MLVIPFDDYLPSAVIAVAAATTTTGEKMNMEGNRKQQYEKGWN